MDASEGKKSQRTAGRSRNSVLKLKCELKTDNTPASGNLQRSRFQRKHNLKLGSIAYENSNSRNHSPLSSIRILTPLATFKGKNTFQKPNLQISNPESRLKPNSPNFTPLFKDNRSSTRNSQLIRRFNTTVFEKKKEKNLMEDYLMGKIIGQGAYAVVRQGWDKSSNTQVAIKTYEKARIIDPHRKKNVQREIKILKMLDHPNIMKLYEVIDTNKYLHLVCEFISGCSLRSIMKSRGNAGLNEREAKKYFRQLVSAVEYCHNKNVTHRDLKFENVIVDDRNNVKLIDFGFSTCFPKDKKVKLFCGTPSYMAPEIVSRKDYKGPPVDIWALGVFLFAMLAGYFPFKAETDRELYRQIINVECKLPKSLPADVKNLIGKLLVSDPDKRLTINALVNEEWLQNSYQFRPSENS